jgi:hypothetical protein
MHLKQHIRRFDPIDQMTKSIVARSGLLCIHLYGWVCEGFFEAPRRVAASAVAAPMRGRDHGEPARRA